MTGYDNGWATDCRAFTALGKSLGAFTSRLKKNSEAEPGVRDGRDGSRFSDSFRHDHGWFYGFPMFSDGVPIMFQ